MKEFEQTSPGNPYEQFDISQFASAPSDSSETENVQAINEDMFRMALDRFSDFRYPSPTGEDAIKLEHRTFSGGMVDITVYDSGRFGIYHWPDAETPQPNSYVYEKYPDGILYRHDNSPADRGTAPSRGNIPMSMKVQMMRKINEIEEPNRELEQKMGVAHITGSDEMAYVAGLVEQSEPATVGAVKLLTVVHNRSRSQYQPSDQQAAEAAPLFKKSIQDFLQSNDPQADGAFTALSGKIDLPLGGDFAMEYGVSEVDGVPSFELWASRILQPGQVVTLIDETGGRAVVEGVKFEEVAQYTIEGDKMITNNYYRVYDKDGRLERAMQRHVANAESNDVRDVRHFLNNPRYSRKG